MEALKQVLGLIQHVLHVVDHVVKHRGQQGVRQLFQLGRQGDGVLQHGGILLQPVGQGVQPVPQLIARRWAAAAASAPTGPASTATDLAQAMSLSPMSPMVWAASRRFS